ADLLEEAARDQGRPSEWQTARWSEDQLIRAAQKNDDPERKTALALGCILSVLARGALPAEPYKAFERLPTRFWERHPVNLMSVPRFVRDRQTESAAAVLTALVKEKVLFQHLRVAMRKLRDSKAQATFKFVVEDGQ